MVSPSGGPGERKVVVVGKFTRLGVYRVVRGVHCCPSGGGPVFPLFVVMGTASLRYLIISLLPVPLLPPLYVEIRPRFFLVLKPHSESSSCCLYTFQASSLLPHCFQVVTDDAIRCLDL